MKIENLYLIHYLDGRVAVKNLPKAAMAAFRKKEPGIRRITAIRCLPSFPEPPVYFAAKCVVNAWEHGDLAQAVRQLDTALRES